MLILGPGCTGASRGEGTPSPGFGSGSLERFLGNAVPWAVQGGKCEKGFPSSQQPKQRQVGVAKIRNGWN